MHAQPAHTQISLYAHAHGSRMIKVLCRGDSEWCSAAACFPRWIQATSFNREETRHHKCEIRGNYVVICHMKYFFVAKMGFPLLQMYEKIYSTHLGCYFYRHVFKCPLCVFGTRDVMVYAAPLQMFYAFLCHCHPIQLAQEINPARVLINDSDQVRL